jgi:hypothetical protein
MEGNRRKVADGNGNDRSFDELRSRIVGCFVPEVDWTVPDARYFGHGGAEQYIRSYKVRHLPHCATVMLWGCSSGALKDQGDLDRTGTAYNYILAGWYVSLSFMWPADHYTLLRVRR